MLQVLINATIFPYNHNLAPASRISDGVGKESGSRRAKAIKLDSKSELDWKYKLDWKPKSELNWKSEWGRFINKKRGEKNKNRVERQKNSKNQVTLDSIFGASKKHYLSNFVLYML
jgi:hypothetical protein